MKLSAVISKSTAANADLPFCAELHPSHVESWTYTSLAGHIDTLAAFFRCQSVFSPSVAILGSRTYRTYLAALAAVVAGRPFVCLNPTWPSARVEAIMREAGAGVLVISDSAFEAAAAKLRALDMPRLYLANLSSVPKDGAPLESPDELPAYYVATSGSTGTPKLIPIPRSSLEAYLAVAPERRFLSQGMGMSQSFDQSFDPGIGDIFNALCAGACLYPISDHHRADLRNYLKRSRISYWNSAPSLLSQAFALGQFEGFTYEGLTQACFIGEPLPVSLARNVSNTFPSAEVWNQYGPAEATIAISAHQWSPSEERAIVSIGKPFEGIDCALLGPDQGFVEIAGGRRGELLLAGAQVFSGYAVSGEDSPFLTVSGEKFFRTRDLVEIGDDGAMHFLGRADWSFKVAGHRVEPREVEEIFLSVPGVTGAIHGAPPADPNGFPRASILWLEGAPDRGGLELAMERCRKELPVAQVPREIFQLPAFPLGPHLKVDRRALLEQYLDKSAQKFRIDL